MHFTKAHAYGNDFLYVRAGDLAGVSLDALARELCDRHAGIGADGLIVYEPTPDGASRSAPKYGTSAWGKVTLPSGCWCTSSSAAIVRGSATPEALSVCTNSGLPPARRNRMFARRA